MDARAYGEVIHGYSRAEAIQDGVLVTASEELLVNARITVPVAYTASVFADCIAWNEEDNTRRGLIQDQTGREWDVLWMLRTAMRRAGDQAGLTFSLFRFPRNVDVSEPTEVTLHVVIGPGDEGEPVITVMSSPDEI